jgi:hypothetical protein
VKPNLKYFVETFKKSTELHKRYSSIDESIKKRVEAR